MKIGINIVKAMECQPLLTDQIFNTDTFSMRQPCNFTQMLLSYKHRPKRDICIVSEGSKSSTHYLSDKSRFEVSSKGPSSGISVILIPDEGPLLETSNPFLSLR